MMTTTPKTSFRQLFAANVGSLTTITDVTATTTEPTGSGVYGTDSKDDSVYNAVKLMFWGVGAAATTFTARIWGWHLHETGGTAKRWVPVHLLDVLVTLGATGGGVDGFYGTTITAVGTPTLESSGYAIESPGSNRVAMVKVDPGGARKIQVQLGTTATATSANCAAAGF